VDINVFDASQKYHIIISWDYKHQCRMSEVKKDDHHAISDYPVRMCDNVARQGLDGDK
jgi:hypothetical protein